ncbi:MAG: nucleotidyltransferase [Candidatus Scalindua sp.]|jgi:nucleotidyltransferase substrate binding protein (TIGR01987 family)|nr:nucleotidyltransferase [Candidatus Scalindua sp.]MBT5303635.1 nucleotidyltransferase [Candidatus Scalindua sp.]MBT6050844.1 nucleotidyltransferase [Candidatus Scalindua sp.]MBT6229798.1 nucleotidyltransferase [Candidatus Scalindua sp.]MBT7211241.1 nucleotidyltransferase [Candidatus Scalindua sp.]
MDNQDIRWIQRFQNFEKAFLLLRETVQIESPSVVERAGLIQFFEMTFELAWKLLKDYEEEEGFEVKSPRDAIKQAFQANLIIAGHTWIDALEDRNLTSHTYHEKIAVEVEEKIRNKYFPVLEKLYIDFKDRVDKK